jgi:cytochrome c553
MTMKLDKLPLPVNQRLGRRTVKAVRLLAVFQLAILAVGFWATSHAKGRDTSGRSRSEFEAKINYCQDCHGPSGQGYRGFYPIPRLAGQQIEYLKNQLQAFVEHRRTNNIMFNVSHTLSPAMFNALATRFREFDPRPIGGAPKNLVPEGQRIFENGVPEANVAACAACHGPEATGRDQFPRLAGQLNTYVIKTLSNWGQERGQNPAKPDTSAVMLPVAHSLTRAQIEAVAAYVSTLR